MLFLLNKAIFKNSFYKKALTTHFFKKAENIPQQKLIFLTFAARGARAAGIGIRTADAFFTALFFSDDVEHSCSDHEQDNGNGDDIDPIHDLYLKPLKVPFLFSWQHFLREAACFFL